MNEYRTDYTTRSNSLISTALIPRLTGCEDGNARYGLINLSNIKHLFQRKVHRVERLYWNIRLLTLSPTGRDNIVLFLIFQSFGYSMNCLCFEVTQRVIDVMLVVFSASANTYQNYFTFCIYSFINALR